MEHMTDEEVVEKLRRVSLHTRPDPARLKLLITPQPVPVPSPLSGHFVMRTTVGALVLVLVVLGAAWSTTPAARAPDEYQIFSAALEEDFSGAAEALALLDQGVEADLAGEDVFTDEFLDAAL